MRLKNKSVNIKNLWPEIKDKLTALDNLMLKSTGTELVITSGNDSNHWGSKKPPDNWNEMSIEQIRDYSNSLHYKDRAIDIRTWAIYDLPRDKQVEFIRKMRKIFPKDKYDIVREKDHIHIEFDPKPIKAERIDLREKEIEIMSDMKPEVKIPVIPKEKLSVPFYRRNGFKRITGSIIFIVGTIMSLIPRTSEIGKAILSIGGAIGITGIAHSQIKRKNEGKPTFVSLLIQLLQKIIDWLKGLKNK